ncbi:MAG TPA: isoleucine--tRNA ligase [Gemmatimonadales bacterium]|nr:isoleucine--tRNA ligase [Gemmatimonadales bacterium]
MSFAPWPAGSADELEEELRATWRREGLFQQTLDRTRSGKPFVFFEGPPTANGRPGIHHVFARTIKDLICRFRTMQGRQVTRIAGWDTHGLPVEIEIEKQLNLNGKKAIEEYGVEKFNALCRASVFKYKGDWEELSDRTGYWLDYAHPYITYSNEYVESVWWILKRLAERDLLYRGHRVLPYCPRCGTVLSSHELALGYEEVRDKSIYVTFPLTDGSGRELVVWTTTPWTLPANVAVAVHADMEYGEYALGDRTLVIATSRAGAVKVPAGGKVVPIAELPLKRTVMGREMAGLSYSRPLEIVPLPDDRKSRLVVAAEFVTADDGSGMVHLAPAFGADDHAAGREHGLALVRPVAPDGTFSGTTWPEIEGKLVTAEETNDLIIRRLKAEGRWLATESYEHSYPHCWRCRSKLIYYARDSWFVRTSAVKQRMQELNAAVNWNPPEVGSGRFGEWLANNVDWALSRDRYWGTPLPVWSCDQEPAHVEVVGSYARLAELWGKPLPKDFDPHKPFIDGYTWRCHCGGEMRRAPEVIDTWFDSGSMPYAQWHYPFEHEAEFKAHFPADYICEGVDQTRGWFYSLLAIAATAFDQTAYRNVIVNELVLDADGQKMSKTKGNVVDPWDMVREFGADAVRLYLLASSQVWLPKKFDKRSIPESVGGFLNTLRNSYTFFAAYSGDWRPGSPGGTPTLADRWLRSRLDATVRAVTAAWEGYDVTSGVRALMDFVVTDLSNWYVRVNRSRFWAPDHEADPAAVATLHEALVTVARLLAPAAPFASDWLHRSLTGGPVHLADFPVSAGREDGALDAAMDGIRRLASLARAARGPDLKVRQSLARMQVAVPAAVRGPHFEALLETLGREVNVKQVRVVGSEAELVRLKGKPNFRELGKRYGKQTPEVAALVSTLTQDQLRTLESGGEVRLEVNGAPIVYLSADVVVEREVVTDWLVQSDGPFVVALDPALTPELKREGLARELVHLVQRLRKDAGYDFAARILLAIDGDPGVLDAAREFADFIAGETLARQILTGESLPGADRAESFEIEGMKVRVAVRQLVAGAGAP